MYDALFNYENQYGNKNPFNPFVVKFIRLLFTTY